jgi:transglutaminase-like putative cysteine protease
MPRFHARHTTEIRYSRAISQSVNEVRLTPLAGGRQRLEWSSLRAEPAARIEAGRDGFGNAVHRFALPHDHDALMVESTAMVQTRPAEVPGEWEAVGLERVADPAYSRAHAAYLLPSRYVRWQGPVDSLARSLPLPEDDGAAAWLRAVEGAVGEAIAYARGATRVDTSVEDVVRLRRGVCQDMAHLFIALCRRRGVAARYVSGWMHNPHRAGPGASHAWAEAAVPGHGWTELDPTNPGSSLERHVRLAVGRDYDDVPPLRGRFRGRTAQELRVSVELRAVEEG